MLLPNQKVVVKWHTRNKKWYEEKGYKFTCYGDEFLADTKDLSKGAKCKVKVQCDYCGEIHDTLWRDYYVRKDYGKYACKKCRLKKASESTLENRRNDLYDRAKSFCDEYGYVIMTPKGKIMTADTRVDYLCPKHGLHNTKIYTLITRHRCVDCMHEIGGYNQKLSIDEIMDYVEEHGSKWFNPEAYTRTTDKNMEVICPDCGERFTTSFFAFRKQDGQRCPDCSNIESKGEFEVRSYLEKHNVPFIPQYRFYDCRTSVPLPFDFYLYLNNVVIEYDGIGHYAPIKRGKMTENDAKENLKKIKQRDEIKTNYCKENGIRLVRIPYWDLKNIETILDIQLFDLHEDIV